MIFPGKFGILHITIKIFDTRLRESLKKWGVFSKPVKYF